MATPEQLKAAILQADAAGDTESAQRFAQMYKEASARAPPKSLKDAFVGFSDDVAHGLQGLTGKYGRSAMQTGGMALGGLVAAPFAVAAGIPSGGAGAAAVEAGGVGAGSALGGHYYDTARDYFTGSKSPTLADQLKAGAQDFSSGAAIVPGARLAGGALSRAVPLARSAGQGLARLLDAGATPAAATVRQAALARAMAQEQASRAAASVSTGKALGASEGAVYNTAQQRMAAALSQPQAPVVGDVTAATDVGAPVQQAAAANLDAIHAAKDAADEQLREAMEAVANEQSANGVGVSDVPEAKALIAETKAKLNPKGHVVTPPVASEATAYNSILDALSPKEVPVGRDMRGQPGVELRQGPMQENGVQAPGTYVQIQKPSLEAIVKLRRQLSEAAYGGTDPQGFAAIGKLARQDLIAKLKTIEDAYTSGASAPVRANWHAALQKAEQYDTKVGSALTATQGDTGVLATTPSQVPANIINKGREGYRQAAQLAGPKVAQKMVQDSVQAALTDPVTGGPISYAKAVAAVGPKSKLGDILQSPDLAPVRQQVQQHLAQLRAAEAAAEQATAYGKASSDLAKASGQHAQAAADMDASAKSLQADIADLSNPSLPRAKVVATARGVVDKMFANGKGSLSNAERDSLMELANHADNAAARSAFRRKVALYGAVGAGLSAEGVKIGGHAMGILP